MNEAIETAIVLSDMIVIMKDKDAEIKRLREEVKRERGFKESYLQSMNELLENRK